MFMNNTEQKAFFQGCLYEGLLQLMENIPFERISISALCETAGVSRMTFYRSYSTKEEILLQHLDECFAVYLKHLQAMKAPSAYEVSISFFAFWSSSESHFLELIVKNGLAPLLVERFYVYLQTLLPFLFGSTDPKSFVRSFLAGGLYQMLIDWVKDGSRTSIEEMAAFLAAGSSSLAML